VLCCLQLITTSCDRLVLCLGLLGGRSSVLDFICVIRINVNEGT
jgi:hypothetical protein